jgi:hypothetical protein
MQLIFSEKYTKERRIAELITKKLKKTAATLKSNDPTHKNGVKYMISRKVYDDIILVELNKKKLSTDTMMIVVEFINCKLKPIK